MITVFNRKELLVTGDPSALNRAELILNEHGIDYKIRLDGQLGGNPPGAGRMRGLSQTLKQSIYRIYVKKDAYEYASYLIRNT